MTDSNESEVNEYEAGLARLKGMRFGCIVENLYASRENPRRVSIFIRPRKHKGQVVAECTDGKGDFWLSGIELLFFREPPPKRSKLIDQRPFTEAKGRKPETDELLDILFRDGTELYEQNPSSWYWGHCVGPDNDDDIVGWRYSK